jgi:hypothetical protein
VGKPAASCVGCLSWGVLEGRYCRACYDFAQRHDQSACGACHRLMQTVLDWLDHRRARWPATANPHLIINQQTALSARPVGTVSITASLRGLTATHEALRVDRQLDEALTRAGQTPSSSPPCSASTRKPPSATPTPPAHSWKHPPNTTTAAQPREPKGRIAPQDLITLEFRPKNLQFA